jgi:hypothetical protein
MVNGLETPLQGKVKGCCQGCNQGKQHREPFPENEHIAREKLELIVSDIKGPINPKSHGGFRYFLTFQDVSTKKQWVYLLRHKWEAFQVFKDWKAAVELQSSCKVKILRSDQGGEYITSEFRKYLKVCGIKEELTVTDTAQQNGRSERVNRTLMEMARSMTNGAGLGRAFWGEGILTACYLKNRSPHSALEGNMTPEEKWSGFKPSIRHLKVFGCQASVHVLKKNRGAVDPKSEPGIMVGYSPSHKGYRIWMKGSQKVKIARDVIFHEEPLVESNRIGNKVVTLDGQLVDMEDLEDSELPDSEEDMGQESGITTEVYPDSSNIREVEEQSVDRAAENGGEEAQPVQLTEQTPRRSTRAREQPQRLTAERPGQLHLTEGREEGQEEIQVAKAYLVLAEEPINLQAALASKEALKWTAAVNEELESLKENHTWDVVDKPTGKNVVGCKWVFKVKSPQQEGGECRYKARLVAKGYSQKHGIDYHETFAPVIKYQSLRMLMSIATQRQMHIHQMDVRTAFLYGELEEDIYMELPEGYGKEFKEGKALKLRKSLYGLKQSPRCWNSKVHEFMEQQGFKRLATDSAVYTKEKGKTQVILGVYVDDLLIIGEDLQEVQRVKEQLKGKFRMVDFGECSKVLGIRITRNRAEGILRIDQEEYIKGILVRFGMDKCKVSSTPLCPKMKLSVKQGPADNNERARMAEIPYREAIGSLMYLMVSTRPDLAQAVGILSRFLNDPGETHWTEVKRVFRYLQGSRDLGIVYRRTQGATLEGYTDSDWAGDVDDRRSTSAYVMMLGGGAVSWKSKRMSSPALSSTEAEYMAATEASKEVLWIKDFLWELGMGQGTVVVYSDNQSSIKVMRNPVGHGRMKHIELQAYFVRDLIAKKQLEFVYCPTEEMVADSLTKAVPREKILLCNKWMGLEKKEAY